MYASQTQLGVSFGIGYAQCCYLYALMVGKPLIASPIEEYTGEREMESSLFTSLTLACKHISYFASLKHSTAQHSTAQHSTAQHSTAQQERGF